MKPLTVFFEVSGPFQWRPRWFNAPFDCGQRGRFKRIVWLWFGVAWVRIDLYSYNRHIAGGNTNWILE